MSTIAVCHFERPDRVLQHRVQLAEQSATVPWLLMTTAVIVGIVFFAAGHDLLTSRAVAYTQSAEEMQAAALGGNFLRRMAFLVLGGWGLMLFVTGQQRLTVDWPLAGSLGALAALAGASLLWADDPSLCIRRLLVL